MKCDKSWRHKTLHGHQRVSSRLPLTGVRGAQGQWACACPRGEDSISTDTYGQTVVCLRRQLAMISSATPATARNAKGILTEYLCGKNTFDSATLVYFVLFVNTFECSTSLLPKPASRSSTQAELRHTHISLHACRVNHFHIILLYYTVTHSWDFHHQ